MLVRSTICPALPWSDSVPGLSGTWPDVHLGADVPEKYCIQMWQMCKNIGNAGEIINNQHILILIQPYS